MRKILIVGAGQAGLQLGLGLLRHGYDVTIMSARTPEELRSGWVRSTPVIFGPGLRIERDLGVNLWEEQTPQIHALEPTVATPPGDKAITFRAPLDDYAQSVDQRVKMAGWMELFENRGGRIIYHSVMPSDLEGLVGLNDLTIVAAGNGELAGLFERDAARSPFHEPQRVLAAVYVHGVPLGDGHDAPHVGINAHPGVGELFSIPAYTTSGPCHIELIEGVPGGPFDCWRDRPHPKTHLDRMRALLREYFPWEYERTVDAEPTDGRSSLIGGFPPVVRKPYARLSSTACVLGMGNAVVANDPIAGQGANSAVRAAHIYLRSILERGDRPFDVAWMQRTFDAYWEYARHPTMLSNALLGALPPHVHKALRVAAHNPAVARRFVNVYADPADFHRWLADPAETDAYLASVAAPTPPADAPATEPGPSGRFDPSDPADPFDPPGPSGPSGPSGPRGPSDPLDPV